MNEQTPVSGYNQVETPDLLQYLMPAAFLSAPAKQTLAYGGNITGRALIGMQFGMPGSQYGSMIKPSSDVSVDLYRTLDRDLDGLTADGIMSAPNDLQGFFHDAYNICKQLDRKGFIAFDTMRDDPPMGIGMSLNYDLPVYCVKFKEPQIDWIPTFSDSKPTPYTSWEMRRSIAQYAIVHPDKFNFFALKPGINGSRF